MVTYTPEGGPKVVLVMGITGVGKSTFIKYATGLDVEVGHNHNACTQKVALYPIPSENTILADTPGFDDTFRNDGDILKDVNECLAASFHKHWNIAGALYVHPITEVRMKGSAMKNIRIFQKILGSSHMSNCIFVTTKWSLQDPAVSEAREEELMEGREFWKPMLDRGASVKRFRDTRESALEIVDELTRKASIVPQMTHETQNLKVRLIETDAGRVVDEGLRQEREKHLREMKELKEDLQRAGIEKDKRWEEDIRIEREKTEAVLKQLRDQQEVLHSKPGVVKSVMPFFRIVGASALLCASVAATVATDGIAAGTIPYALSKYVEAITADD